MTKNNFYQNFAIILTSILLLLSSNSMAQESADSPNLKNLAIVQGLNKITAKTSTLEIKAGETINFGQIEITAHKCWQAPLDQTPESKILLEIFENKASEKVKIFYGWMFASSPSVSTLEHPIYDITAINCKNHD